MAKPSNQSLIAERRELREALGADTDESTAAALKRVLDERERKAEKLAKTISDLGETVQRLEEASEAAAVEATARKLNPVAQQPEDPNRHIGPHPGLPVDTAIYLPRGQALPEPPPGTLTAQQGDLGDKYVRWLLANAGPDRVREYYGEQLRPGPDKNTPPVRHPSRIHLLPYDVQEAIK